MVNCEHCGDEVILPFKCHYCQGLFCEKCRLPETHQCPHLALVRSQRKEAVYRPRTPPTGTPDPFRFSRDSRQRSPGGWVRRIFTRPTVDFGRREPWRLMGGTTTGNEALDILIAAALIFGILGFRNLVSGPNVNRSYLAGILLTIMTGFVAHELAHRSIARRNGLSARFVLWTQGIIFTLFGLLIPFVFIVPGFVFITGYATRAISGKVALSGPAINILNGLILLFLWWFVKDVTAWSIHLGTVLSLAAQLNFFLALFNLLPIGPLDGRKVREWNPVLWTVSLGSSVLLWLIVFVL